VFSGNDVEWPFSVTVVLGFYWHCSRVFPEAVVQVRLYILLATRHLLPLMRDVDYTTGLHTMGAPCRLAVTFCSLMLIIFGMKAPMQIRKGGWDVTFVEAMRNECKILGGKYFRAETT
jgi:hypothetical protein